MSSNNQRITLELTGIIKELGIVSDFFVEKKANVLKLELNHEYGKKTVVSPIHTTDWIKTTDTFTKRLKEKMIEDSHIVQLVDILSNNYAKVVGLDDNSSQEETISDLDIHDIKNASQEPPTVRFLHSDATQMIVKWELQNDQENAWWTYSCGSPEEIS